MASLRPALVALVALLCLPRPAAAVELIFAADLGGHFAARRCGGPPLAVGPGLPALADAVARARARAAEAGAESLVIGGPGLLGPGNLARYLLGSDEGSAHAARLIGEAGVEILTPGTYEFTSRPAGLRTYLSSQRAAGRPAVLSNIDCAAAGGCPLLQRSVVVVRGGVRIALLSAVPESLPRRVGRDHVPFSVLAPATLAKEVRRLRAEERADAVVVVSELDREADPAGAVALVQGLEELGAHVDVVFAARQDHPKAAVASVALGSGTVIVGAPSGGAGVAAVSLTLDNGVLTARPGTVLAQGPAPALAGAIARVHERMCQEWGRTLGELPAGGLSRSGFLALVLEAMRLHTKAEIALINGGAVEDSALPLLTANEAGVYSALPFPAQVVRVRLTGKAIADALLKYAPKAGEPPLRDIPYRGKGRRPAAQVLPMLGVTRDGDSLKVNGRPLDPAATYRVATIDFVAGGGDDLLPPELTAKDTADKQISVQELVISYLAEGHGAGLLPLIERPLWTSALDLGVDLQGVTIRQPEGIAYDRPQLTRRPAVALKIDGSWRVQMDMPAHLLQLTFRSLYGQTYFAAAAEEAPAWQETTDLLSGLLLYSYRGLSKGLRVVPTPFASLGLETEWSRPDARDYHHLEISALGGLRAALWSKASLSAGVGVRRELLARGYSSNQVEADVARARFLFSSTLEILKGALVPRLGSALLGELALTYNFTDPGRLRSHELRATGKLHVALGRPLYATVGLEVYLYGDQGREPGVALDATAGVKVLLDSRRQVF